jgi:hypothetical protein
MKCKMLWKRDGKCNRIISSDIGAHMSSVRNLVTLRQCNRPLVGGWPHQPLGLTYFVNEFGEPQMSLFMHSFRLVTWHAC